MRRVRVTKKQLLAEIMNLQERLADPEGTVQRLLNERYSRDLRERELQHHADWDAEVVVHKMAAARWMRGCASAVATVAGDLAIAAEIEALPLVPES
jgi:predicted KAP-like P-loop ATPase